jgi:A/G-specific adenine glycosylase
MKPAPLARLLGEWYCRGHRDLPWRRSSDPYRIWISEIMLQQTRAQAVIPYYERFLARFPTVEKLAQSGEDEVLALWSGLGYYSRARNLRRAAAQIVDAGGFPREFAAIRALPGIGDYTAAAIASIAHGQPHAVLDGNVLRVVARVQNDSSEIGLPRTRDRFRAVAQSWLDPRNPGLFNQALMELGATVCLPRNPLCLVCPISRHCQGLQQGTVAELPVKLRKREPVRIDGVLLLVRRDGRVLLRRNSPGARRLAGFWDLPAPEHLPKARLGPPCGEFRHTITHHQYRWTVREALLRSQPEPSASLRWFDLPELSAIPLTTTARKGLKLAHLL